MPLGTVINMITVIVGASLGTLLHNLIPDQYEEVLFQAIGLGVFLIGIKMALAIKDEDILIFMFSLILGSLLGYLINVKGLLEAFANGVQNIVQADGALFSEGLLLAFLIFCVGSMTIVGAIDEGLRGNRTLLKVKSMMDGFTSIALASTYGIGVAFSVIPMFFFQGSITVLAKLAKSFFGEDIIRLISGVGGVLIMAVSINMLKLGEIDIETLLPSLVVVVVLVKLKKRYIRL